MLHVNRMKKLFSISSNYTLGKCLYFDVVGLLFDLLVKRITIKNAFEYRGKKGQIDKQFGLNVCIISKDDSCWFVLHKRYLGKFLYQIIICQAVCLLRFLFEVG